MGETFGDKFWTFRAADQKRARLNADWAAVNGPLGSVIGTLRARAARARRAAWAFLVLLFVTAGAGLAFYLGLPLWQSFADGRLDTLNATLRTIEVEDATLDGQRADLRGKIAETLALTFDPLPTGVDVPLRGHVQVGDVLLLYGADGTVLRARTDLSGFDPVPTGTEAWLTGHVQQGDALLLYGHGGTVLRARADLSGFDPVPTATEATLNGHAQLGDTLFLYGDIGTGLRARPDLSGFDTVPTGTRAMLLGHVQQGEALLLYGRGVRRARADLSVSTFDLQPIEMPTGLGVSLYGHVQPGEALLLYGSEGTVLRARTDLSGFDAVPTGTGASLLGHVQSGDVLLLYGDFGTVLRARTDLSGFDPVPLGLPPGIGANLLGHAQRGDALLLYGQGGAVLRARTDLSGFDPVPTGSGVSLLGHVQWGDSVLFYGDGDAVLQQTSRRKTEADAVTLPAGVSGDAALRAFIESLPPHLRGWSAMQDHAAALTAITNQRAALDILRSRTDAEIEEYERSPLAYLRNDTAVAFDRFLALCRGESTAPEVTTACLDAWQTDQTSGQTWWRGVLDQVPPGILLLFLLATSAALYRYNVRLAGFHDSRADVLTLLVQTRDPAALGQLLAATPADLANLTALVMAADKVEMGAIKAKLGSAEIELARMLGAEK